jgi:hypothetical protein
LRLGAPSCGTTSASCGRLREGGRRAGQGWEHLGSIHGSISRFMEASHDSWKHLTIHGSISHVSRLDRIAVDEDEDEDEDEEHASGSEESASCSDEGEEGEGEGQGKAAAGAVEVEGGREVQGAAPLSAAQAAVTDVFMLAAGAEHMLLLLKYAPLARARRSLALTLALTLTPLARARRSPFASHR